MKKFLLFIAAALVIAGCEKKEYWEHDTPKNPVIAHLMCVEIKKAPDNCFFGIAIANAQTGAYSDRFVESNFTSDQLPIKLYTDGGLRLDREVYIMMIQGNDMDNEDLENSALNLKDSIPMFKDGTLIYKKDTIGLPTELSFSGDGIEGKWYFRFD